MGFDHLKVYHPCTKVDLISLIQRYQESFASDLWHLKTLEQWFGERIFNSQFALQLVKKHAFFCHLKPGDHSKQGGSFFLDSSLSLRLYRRRNFEEAKPLFSFCNFVCLNDKCDSKKNLSFCISIQITNMINKYKLQQFLEKFFLIIFKIQIFDSFWIFQFF